MNFDFSDEQKQLRDEARRSSARELHAQARPRRSRGQGDAYDKAIWKGPLTSA